MPVGHKTRKQIDQLERQLERERERERNTHTHTGSTIIMVFIYYKTKHNVFFMKQIQLYMAIKR